MPETVRENAIPQTGHAVAADFPLRQARVAPAAYRELRTRLSVVAIILALLAGLHGSGSPSALAAGEGQVLATVYNSKIGYVVQIRKGGYNDSTDKGYGWVKICGKHNFCTLDGLRWLYRSTNVRKDSTQMWTLFAYARKWVNGKLVSQVRVRAVYNRAIYPKYWGYEVGGRLGAMTAYCDGYNPSCPSWIPILFDALWDGSRTNGTASVAATNVPGDTSGSEVTYTVSYEEPE